VRRGAGSIGFSAVRLILEDCRTLHRVEFLVDKVRRRFRLVRHAPVASGDTVDVTYVTSASTMTAVELQVMPVQTATGTSDYPG
jgi:hypothetical protein